MPKNYLVSAKKDGGDEPSKSPKKKKDKSSLKTQYGIYSGIVDENGKTKTDPSESEAISNMAGYMKNNMPPQADNPSNVYRPKFSHLTMAYNRKKKQNTA